MRNGIYECEAFLKSFCLLACEASTMGVYKTKAKRQLFLLKSDIQGRISRHLSQKGSMGLEWKLRINGKFHHEKRNIAPSQTRKTKQLTLARRHGFAVQI